jgi:FkbM family methyltransferase
MFHTLFERIRRTSGLDTVAISGTSIVMSRCDGRDQVLEHALRAGWEDFERPLPRVFRDAVMQSSGLVVDVGANTGFYALIAGHCGRHVLAFEPVPQVRDILAQNVKANRLTHAIKISSSAASDRRGRATLYMPDPSHGLIETSSSLSAEFQSYASTIEVDVAPLDELLPSGRRIGVVKIDAEGHEAAVLRGAVRVLERDRPVLFVEVLPRAEMEYLTALLAKLDYVDIPLRPEGVLTVESAVRFVPDAWNHAFMPREADRRWILKNNG